MLYVAGTAVMVALVAHDALSDDVRPVATAAEGFGVLPLATPAVVAAARAAFLSTGNAGILSAARYPLAMARDGFVWERRARLDRNGTPRAAVLVTGAATAGLILSIDVEPLAKLASAFLLLVFGALCAAVLILRASGVDGYQPSLYRLHVRERARRSTSAAAHLLRRFER